MQAVSWDQTEGGGGGGQTEGGACKNRQANQQTEQIKTRTLKCSIPINGEEVPRNSCGRYQVAELRRVGGGVKQPNRPPIPVRILNEREYKHT